MNNKFSFYTLPKSEVLNSINESGEDEQSSDVDMEEITIYRLNNDSIIEEYCFDNGDCTLYCDAGNDSLALLYSTSYDDSSYSIYSCDGVYIAINSGPNIEKVGYMNKNNFLSLVNRSSNLNRISVPFNSIHIIYDGVNKVKEMYDKFHKLNLRYSIMSKYIPASYIIDSTIDKINHYIATGELNRDELLDDYTKLQNFQELCYDSIYKISGFLADPSHTDLRSLSEGLQKNSTNISNLMDLYLIDDLENQDKDR